MEETIISNEKAKTYERHDYECFSIMKETTTGQCQITIGKNIMCATEFASVEDAKAYIDEKPWEIILNTCALMADNIYKYNQKPNENA